MAGASAGPARPLDELSQALLRAETDLARGEATAAIEGLERVASSGHSAEVELGLVRAYMQAGAYRRALGFAAHVAGEHADVPAAAVLYAWLLHAGGQIDVSARVLGVALARAPADSATVAAARALATTLPVAEGVLLDAPHRMAPYAVDASGAAPPSAEARSIGSGVLIEGGRFALVPARSLSSRPTRIWVRNGLGETREAEIDSGDSAGGSPDQVVVLRLRQPLVSDLQSASRDPFAGSRGFAFQYAHGGPAAPAWPQLRQGFFGALRGPDHQRPLGIEVSAGQPGGPVLDAAGQLAGMVLSGADGQALLLPVSQWPRFAGRGDLQATPATPWSALDPRPSPRPPIPADEAYERALRVALQVIAQP